MLIDYASFILFFQTEHVFVSAFKTHPMTNTYFYSKIIPMENMIADKPSDIAINVAQHVHPKTEVTYLQY